METNSERQEHVTAKETGHCFSNCGRFILTEGMSEHSDRFVLVHGIVHGQGQLAGYEFPHAWLENRDTGFALDITRGVQQYFPIDAYRKRGRAHTITEYSPQDVVEKTLETKHWGPWKPEYDFTVRKVQS